MGTISLKLAQKLILENKDDKNVACSPLSLDALLCLLASGSSGRTLDQLKAALSCHDHDMINSMASRIVAVASNTSTPAPNHEIQIPSPNHDHNRVRRQQNHGHSVPAWNHQVQSAPPRGLREKGALINFDPLTQSSNQQVDGLIVSFVNGIWVDKKFPLKESFRGVASEVHNAQVQSVDFKNQSEEVRIEINKWVEESTCGLIKGLVKEDMITPQTIMVLANALYFKGLWSTCFNKRATKPKKFYLLNGRNHEVPFMTNWKPQFFKSFDTFKLLKLPYKSNSQNDSRCFSMYIFLPHERDGLYSLAQGLTSDPHQLMQLDYELWKQELEEFWVPRFKFSCEMDDAGSSFAELGLTLPFDAGAAELTEVCNDRLFASKVIHKCVIEVSEEGTEAAAVTSALMAFGYALNYKPPPKPSFVADHPFLFMIREDRSGAIFFIGAVLDPLKP